MADPNSQQKLRLSPITTPGCGATPASLQSAATAPTAPAATGDSAKVAAGLTWDDPWVAGSDAEQVARRAAQEGCEPARALERALGNGRCVSWPTTSGA